MFDEIFKRWLNNGQLTEEDIVPLFLEWNQEFGDGLAKPEHVFGLMQILHTDYGRLMVHILKMIGIKRGYEWEEVYDQNRRLIAKFSIKKE